MKKISFFSIFISIGTGLLTVLIFLSSVKVKRAEPVIEDNAKVAEKQPVKIPEKTNVTERTDILSPDGKMTLTVQNSKNGEGKLMQTFSISGADGKPQKIYAEVSDPSNPVSVPFNTFSPDDKYIYLVKIDTAGVKYPVMRTDGKNLHGSDMYAEITDLFYSKYQDKFVISDVTGWGGITLLAVNTNTKEGKTGPTFWFDASTLNFIRLSTRFN